MKYDYCVDKILNGIAKNKTIEDIAKKHKTSKQKIKKEIKRGSKIEKEHNTKKGEIANKVSKTIAKDHVFENPKYYKNLDKIEKKN